MKRYRVRLAERAEAHLEKIAAWWEEHRREHPNLVAEELRDAMSTLAAFPLTGPRFRSRFARGARRMLLPRSQYWVSYEVDPDAEEVIIFAVRRTSRG
jgi:plasmid stabilization system protein ParE